MDVLVRPTDRTLSVPVADGRAPWQTGFGGRPAAPASAGRRIMPSVIPVLGGRPIAGRHLVRAPWAEPLAAFAGVIVETQLVPDAWLRPRSAARRALEPSMPAARAIVAPLSGAVAPVATRRHLDGLVAIPVASTRADAVGGTIEPVPAPSDPMPPSDPGAPSDPALPSAPPAGRRGFLGRAVVFTLGLVVSLVAFEAAARIGRR